MTPDEIERRIVLAYAPAAGRDALAALLALDDALAALLRTTSEPALGQIRLAWWREALERLDSARAPAEPVLQGIAREVLPRGVAGAALVPMVHGWEVLVEAERLDSVALERYAAGRGALFALAGRALGARAGDLLVEAGQGWALADLAGHLREADEAAEARAMAAALLEPALAVRWSSETRALGALAHRARMDLAGQASPPRRAARLLWHRMTGR